MKIIDLSLPTRLGLAALSGLLTYPAFMLSDALDAVWQPPILDWWKILHGVLFGALVMVPYISSKDRLGLRATALIISSVVAYVAAIEVPNLISPPIGGEVAEFMEAGVIGAVLVAVATRFIAPLVTRPRYWGFTLVAGIIGGAIFSQTFGICVMDSCDSLAKISPYSLGWVTWQMLVCAAIWFGTGHDPG